MTSAFTSPRGLDKSLRTGAAALAALLTACATSTAVADETEKAMPPVNGVTVEQDGTVNVPAMAVPVSSFLSPEGKAYLTDHLLTMKDPERLKTDPAVGAAVFLQPYIDRQKVLFPTEMKDTEIAGVHVYDYTPAGGVADGKKDKVLIDLHGGGFINCWPGCAELEAMPMASLGGYRVVAVDYRQAPDYKFPAASEDVAKVYTELLKTYPAENIGIYGCSAGGMLTGMSIAWFLAHDLPVPGAAGIYCSGAAAPVNGFGGDANFTATAIGEGRFFAPPAGKKPEGPPRSLMPYLSEVDPYDPLVAPAESDEVLAQFPPTQIITGTRGFELSAAVYTHSRLVKMGVEADLHVWEGMFHGFFYNPDVPESQDAYKVMVDFFNAHLGE